MRLKNIYYILFPLCLALLLSGCAITDEMGRMQWHINELRSDVKGLKEKTPSQLQSQKETLDKNLQEIRGAQETTAKSVSDLLVQLQSLTNEFRVLTGRFEEARYYSDKNSAELKNEREKLAARLREMELTIDDMKKKISQLETARLPLKQDELKQDEGMKQPDAGKTAEEGKSAEAAAKTEGPEKKEPEKTEARKEAPKPDVKDIYLAGYQAFKEGKTVEAREKLTSVLKDYPDNEFSDNARFWIAESFFRDGNHEEAILAYEELLKKDPKSDKIPDALLKQGLSFYALKDEKTGKIILEKLIESYPNSEPANAAKKKLGKPAPPAKKKS